jgi:SAM-dependent methyltransferase
MARLATEADFHGERMGNPGAMYADYRRYPHFAQRAVAVAGRTAAAARILVVGCGYGYLVDALLAAGRPNTWGVDAAPWATGRAAAAVGAAAGARVRQADATSAAALRAAKQAMGLGATQRFDLAVTEDVLPCLTAAEQTALLAAVRQHATALLHVVTPGDPADPRKGAGIDWRSAAAWKALVGAADAVLDAETGELLGGGG